MKQQQQTQIEFSLMDFTPLERLLIEAVEATANAQTEYDEAAERYADRLAAVQYKALSAKIFPGKTEEDPKRAAANDTERSLAMKYEAAQDNPLRNYRKAMREKAAALKLWRTRAKAYTVILQSWGREIE